MDITLSRLSSVAVQIWLLGGALLAGAILFQLALMHVASRISHRQEQGGHGGISSARWPAWFGQCLRSAIVPLTLIVWAFALKLFLPQLARAVEPSNEAAAGLTASLDSIFGAVLAICTFWLLLRLGRFADHHLAAAAPRTETRLDDILLPFAGKILRVVLPLIALLLGASALEVSPSTRAVLNDATSILIIAAVAFLMYQFVDALEELVLAKYRIDVTDNYRARGIHTQVRVLRRVAVALIAVLAFASILMVFDSVRRFGTTILASAGVAGIVIGFAAQRSIATLLAGFQIAITQPIRIGDVVIVENEWGRVEEITLTYVVVQIWDLRRMVVPITWFIERPFQNWTRTSAQILGTVFLYLDYQVPIEDLRAEFERIVRASPLWDQQVVGMQVTDAKPTYMELRGLVSASDAGRAWDLRCEVRENLLAWVVDRYPTALPRMRVQLAALPAPA